jgi:DNA-binding MarR family transcriptional regulator
MASPVTASPAAALLPAALRARPSYALARLGTLVRQECAARLAEAGLSQHQHAILCCLNEFGPACQRDIAARLGLDSGDIVAFLDRLQQGGLVVRERDQRDRRRQVVSLTADGQRTLIAAEELLDAAGPGALAALSAPEQDELARLAARVLAREAPAEWTVPAG